MKKIMLFGSVLTLSLYSLTAMALNQSCLSNGPPNLVMSMQKYAQQIQELNNEAVAQWRMQGGSSRESFSDFLNSSKSFSQSLALWSQLQYLAKNTNCYINGGTTVLQCVQCACPTKKQPGDLWQQTSGCYLQQLKQPITTD